MINNIPLDLIQPPDFQSIEAALIKFFPEKFFKTAKGRSHPVSADLEILAKNDLVRLGIASPGGMVERMKRTTDTFLTVSSLIGACHGDLLTMQLQLSKLWGDIQYRRRILSEIKEAEKFYDVLFELHIGSIYSSRGHALNPGGMGEPDFFIIETGAQTSYWVECKNCSKTNRTYIEKVVTKANKQIKTANSQGGKAVPRFTPQHPGILVLNCRSIVTHRKQGIGIPDQVPQEIEETKKMIEEFLSRKEGCFTSITKVIVMWRDYFTIEMPGQKLSTSLRTRTVEVDHPRPRNPFMGPALPPIGKTIIIISDSF